MLKRSAIETKSLPEPDASSEIARTEPSMPCAGFNVASRAASPTKSLMSYPSWLTIGSSFWNSGTEEMMGRPKRSASADSSAITLRASEALPVMPRKPISVSSSVIAVSTPRLTPAPATTPIGSRLKPNCWIFAPIESWLMRSSSIRSRLKYPRTPVVAALARASNASIDCANGFMPCVTCATSLANAFIA